MTSLNRKSTNQEQKVGAAVFQCTCHQSWKLLQGKEPESLHPWPFCLCNQSMQELEYII